jgi:hypothetical protein
MLKNDRHITEDKVRNEIYSYPLPYQAVGWPLELQDFIREVAYAAARSIIENIYTEKELEQKVEDILLSSSTDSIK